MSELRATESLPSITIGNRYSYKRNREILTAKLTPSLLQNKNVTRVRSTPVGSASIDRSASASSAASSRSSNKSGVIRLKRGTSDKGSDDSKTGEIKGSKKVLRKVGVLRAVKPQNQGSEKLKFMAKKFNYNPQFSYKHPLDIESHPKFMKASDKYLPQAIQIMHNVLVKYGSYEKYANLDGGVTLSEEQVKRIIQGYLRDEGLEDEIRLVISKNSVSKACMNTIKGKPTLTVRPDLQEQWVDGLLRHEVGTHFMRSSNNCYQPWRKAKVRKKMKLLPMNPTEEGLAALNTVLLRQEPSLFRAALLYYATYKATLMSFAELFQDLERFVLDPDVRYEYCLRVKRGLADTSQPGAFCKDQVYLHGALEILKNRHTINFELLIRLGKVSHKDIDKIKHEGKLHKTRIPNFLKNKEVYHEALNNILRKNGLTEQDLRNSEHGIRNLSLG